MTNDAWVMRGVVVSLDVSELGGDEILDREDSPDLAAPPRELEGTTVCVDVVDRDDDEDEEDGAGEYDLGETGVGSTLATGVVFGRRDAIVCVYRAFNELLSA